MQQPGGPLNEKQNLRKNDHDEVAMVKEVIYRGRQLSQSRGPLNKLNSTPDISGDCSRNINLNFFFSSSRAIYETTRYYRSGS